VTRRVAGERRRYSTITPSTLATFTSWGDPDVEKMDYSWSGYVQQGYKASPIVFGAIGARMALFSEAVLKFRSLRDRSLFGTPDLLLLEQPWRNGTTGDLLTRMLQDVDLSGNAFVRLTGDGLERLRPDQVTIVSELVPDASGRGVHREPVAYYHKPDPNDDREPELYPAEEVAHWCPVPDPQATFRGMSWLTPVVRELDSDQGLTAYKTQYLANAATPNLLIRYPDKMKQQTMLDLTERMAARHGGVDNAFKTLTLDQGADATVVGSNFETMALAATQAAGENRILIASGVPGIVVGSREGLQAATYSNYQQAMRRFADITMRPLWRSVCAALAPLVAVPAGAHLWYDTADITALRQGEQEQAQTMLTRATTAETLLRAGYEPANVPAAIDAGDLSLLTHSGLYSSQLLPPGPASPPAVPAGPPPPQGAP
jgi:phage portal protein BeeE